MSKRRIKKDRLFILIVILILLVLGLIFLINLFFGKKDKEYPVLKLIGDEKITLSLNTEYKEPGYTASDETDGDITSKVKTEGSVDSTKAGEYTLTYSVKDKAGNLTTKKRTVEVLSVSPLTMDIKDFTLDGLFTDVTLKETKDGGNDYSDEFIFAGDSMALYYVINGLIPGNRLWHQVSITSETALTSPIYINHIETNKTFVENFKERKPKKVLFTLGTNSVATMKSDYFIEKYKELILKIKEVSPDTILIIQSIPPVSKENDEKGYGLNNDKINKFNYYIAKMCSELDIYFLNSASSMKDSNGQCKEGYCLSDGAHPTKLGQEALLKYMQTHMYE